MNTYDNLKILNKSEKVCIIGHLEPDADALSSMVVLRDFLINFFNIKTVDLFAEVSNFYRSGCDEILEDIPMNQKMDIYDTAIMLDSPKSERLGKYEVLYNNANTKIVIDHHQTNNYSGDVNIVEICSSTCEIIFSILEHFNYNLSSSQKGKIYAGIITDTNNFTVGEYGSRTFDIVSKIISDINSYEIYNHFLAKTTLKNMQLQALAMQNLKTFFDGKVLITYITKEQAQLLDVKFEDYKGIINRLATIKPNIFVCFSYPKDDEYYVSMRAKPNFDVSIIAKKYNGGGHTGASAFMSKNSLQNIENELLSDFEIQLKSNQIKKEKIF